MQKFDYSTTKLLIFPDPVLRKKSELFNFLQNDVNALVQAMTIHLRKYKGIGLAAVQIGILLRLFIIEWPEGTILTFVNPEITFYSDECIEFNEGCLSIPGQKSNVKRSKNIIVKYLNAEQQAQELEASDLLAICIQHEYDHLNGILYIDHLSSYNRAKLLKQYFK